MKLTDVQLARLCQEAYIYEGSRDGFAWREHAGNQVTVISGTDCLSDWILNLQFWPVREYHKQYYAQALKILDSIDLNKTKVFTGHSAGGSIAHICAHLTGLKAVSFGSPHIYKELRWTKSTHISYEIDLDLISKIRYNKDELTNHTVIHLPGHRHDIRDYIRGVINHENLGNV